MPPNPPFNLKQKLASLSLAQSAFSSPSNGGPNSTPDSPLRARMKAFNFTPPWKKQGSTYGSSSPGSASEDGHHRTQAPGQMQTVQEIIPKLIFQAGVDYETRPMVIFNASALPDPDLVSYDLLLTRILSYLNLYVEADYTVVFFAAGSKHAPPTNWIWKAYRSLSRKYRKNLKQLYIVHSSFFSKMLFSLAGAVISPKFFRKLVYVSTLSELAQSVPLTQIDIPPAVYQENLKYETKITLPVPTRSNTFGVPLEDIMGYHGEKGDIPRVVKDSIQYLRSTGMSDEGLFRRSPSSVLLRAAQDAYDRGNVVSLNTFGDAYLAAVLIKKYLRDLPDPIFPEAMYPAIRCCPLPAANDAESELVAVTYIRESILPTLVPCAYILLSAVLHLLHDVSLRSATNRMDSYNLAIVITPNLVKGSNPMRDVMMCAVPGARAVTDSLPGSSPAATPPNASPNPNASIANRETPLGAIIALCIRRYYEIFDEVVDRSEAVKPWKALGRLGASGGQGEGEGEGPKYVLADDDEEFDDEEEAPQIGTSPPTAWNAKRHRTTASSGSAQIQTQARSTHGPPPPPPKPRSTYSIDVGHGPGTRRGSITIGTGKGRSTRGGSMSGSGVEALGITAEGFFTPPSGAPPVPTQSVKDRARAFEQGS